jgi:glycosyltransferase involved in cell wall biosynthesis
MGFRPSQVEVVINPTPQLAYTAITGEQLRALRTRYGIAENEPVIGIASRLYRVKGHHVLLAAFRRILDARPDARLLIVGDGPERANLDAQARSLHVESRVCFTGFQEDVAAHLRLCRVTAIPSVHPEPFGLVAVESLAAGVPVVASRIGGLPEIITDGVAGLLVEPDNPEQLAHGLIRILTDPHLASGLADRCVTESERFSMHRHVQRLEAIFRAVLKEASSGGQPSEPAIEQRAVEQEGATA